MRTASYLSSQFWIGETGRTLRGHIHAQIAACYLATSPHSYTYGLYYVSHQMMAEEMGFTLEEVRSAVALLDAIDYARYDGHTQYVWVLQMAHYQLGCPLKESDNKVAAINKWYRDVPPKVPFLGPFFDRYHLDCHLQARRGSGRPPPDAGPLLRDITGAGSPFDGVPSTPHAQGHAHAAVKERLRALIPARKFFDWFEQLQPGPINGGTITFLASKEAKQYIERFYGVPLQQACAECGHPELHVEIQVGPP